MTLRRRLVLGIVALLAVVSVIIGAVSVSFLRGDLMSRLDRQVEQSADRALAGIEAPFRRGRVAPPDGSFGSFGSFGLEQGQGPGTLVAIAIDGSIAFAGVLDVEGSEQALTEDQQEELLAIEPGSDPRTVDLGELGTYRFVAESTVLGGTAITGLPQREVDSTVAQLVSVVTFVTLLGLAVAAAAGAVIVRRALRPLDRVAQTATDVASLELERGDTALSVRVPQEDTNPRTEVGKVGLAINGMLGHIAHALSERQASENRVRRFVSDASHELRTPLASVRGYAELTRLGGHRLPDDVVHALSRIESESKRMTTIVEDLLLLARLDEGRELERKQVDLTRILLDAVSDAHVTGPDHDWALDIPEQPITVVGDAARLHQAVANLLTNTRVHTPAGTRVTAALQAAAGGEGDQAAGGAVLLRVSDDGPGIDERILPTLFERFVRGDDSRSRSTGSSGLGLAIVHGIVAAHGGTVSVASEPGETVFTVRLPRAEAEGRRGTG